jgi:hypothetical protein
LVLVNMGVSNSQMLRFAYQHKCIALQVWV